MITRVCESRASATTRAITSPITKLIAASGMVTVIVALAIGQRLSPMIFHVLRGTACCCCAAALPLASALRYFCEMVDLSLIHI